MTKSEVEAIKKDLNSLKSNVVELTKTLNEDQETKLDALKEAALQNVTALKTQGQERFEQIKEGVKSEPTKSIGLAFAAGALVSFLLARK